MQKKIQFSFGSFQQLTSFVRTFIFRLNYYSFEIFCLEEEWDEEGEWEWEEDEEVEPEEIVSTKKALAHSPPPSVKTNGQTNGNSIK